MKLVLMSCCAPCSAGAIKQLADGQIPGVDDFIVLFFNPNIFPAAEYDKRLAEQIRYCEQLGAKYAIGEYDHAAWRDAVRGMEDAPERGPRCSACFKFRFEYARRWAAEHGYDAVTSVFGVSRHKDQSQVDRAGYDVFPHPPSSQAMTPPAPSTWGGGHSDATHDKRYTTKALSLSRYLKRNMTDAERLLWYYLRGRRDYSFRKQAPIGNYVVDFLCVGKKLIIELDGEQHGDAVHRAHDLLRDEFLKQHGYRIIRFWNDEIFKNMDSVLHAIYAALECPPPSGSRANTVCVGGNTAGGGATQNVARRGVANIQYIPIKWDEGLRCEINRASDFYRQKYCGCEFSMRRDTEKSANIKKIVPIR